MVTPASPIIQYNVNPRFVPDDIPVWLGNNKDTALIFDNINNELTLQTRNAAGALTDRLRIKANLNNPLAFDFGGNDLDQVNSLKVTGTTGNVLVVDTSTLVVDATNKRIGIGTATPSTKLHISGAGFAVVLERTSNIVEAAHEYWPTGATSGTNVRWGAGLFPDNPDLNAYTIWSFDGAANAKRLVLRNNGNLGFGTTDQFGGGAQVIGIQNATTVPTTNPTGGGILYAEAGALKWRGSAGTITTIALA